MIVLDTDILIEIFDKKSAVGEGLLGEIEGHEIATTSINLHEIVYGFYKVKKEIVSDLILRRFLRWNHTVTTRILCCKSILSRG